jgi:hypothetical protein
VRIVVWDTVNGAFFLDPSLEYELFRQIAWLHTTCYDPETGRQICLWHHSAGDFILKCEGERVSVKLTTIRKYDRQFPFIEDVREERVTALVCFFLDLTVRMRLDRLDGTGRAIIADGRFLAPVIRGFFDALVQMEKGRQGRLPLSPGELAAFLRGLSLQELAALFSTLEPVYMEEEEINMPFAGEGLAGHVKELHEALKLFCP